MTRPLLIVLALVAAPLLAAPREVAITFDDLPDINHENDSIEEQQALTARLVAALHSQTVPAIGFVNEEKLLDDDDQVDPERVGLLEQWLDAGLDLGNHTYGHVDLHQLPVPRYEDDIVRGEAVTRPLMARFGKEPHWFRHPYLNTGTSLDVRREIERFLGDHGYRVAPVTIDDSDWIFDAAYATALRKGSPLLRWRIRHSYVRYIEQRFDWWEKESQLVFGREIPQILLLHASSLNAVTLTRLLRMIRARGYRFVTIDEAMRDDAYQSQDGWTRNGGISWIERWGTTRGLPDSAFAHDPQVPRWVQQYAGAREE